MANTVETRTVQMRFDNAQFEKNVSDTIASLERLNKGIDTANASKGLGNLASANDIGNIATGVETISKRFSTLGIVGMTVLQRLTNAGIDMVTKVGSGFNKVVNQMKTGGFQRAENLEQAKFLLEGLKADVSMVMDAVDKAVTGTSYGLDEAAKAAASFYASGVKGSDELYSSLRAVAGVAAMTGSDYASIADIFTTVAGQGRLMTMQLREMEGRGLNAAAILAESMGKSEAEIREMVTRGEIDFETFSKAMDEAFGSHAQEANKTFSGSLANMKTALSRFGEAFISPAMQAAIPLFNSLREAIASILSVLKKDGGVVSHWTDWIMNIGKSISGLINKLVKLGYFEKIGWALNFAYYSLIKVFDQIKTAFTNVFPKAGIKSIENAISAIRNISSEMYRFIGTSKIFERVFTGIFQVARLIGTVFGAVFTILSKGLPGILSIIGKIIGGIGDLTGALNGKIMNLDLFSNISNALNVAGKVISKAFSMIVSGIGKFVKTIADAVGTVDNLTAVITGVGLVNGLAGMQRSFSSAKYTFDLFRKGVIGVITDVERLADGFVGLPSTIKSTFFQLTKSLQAMQGQIYADTLMKIAAAILALAIGMKMIEGIDPNSLASGLGAMTVLLAELIGAISILFKVIGGTGILGTLKNLVVLGEVSKALMELAVALLIMSFALKNIAKLDPKEMAVGLIGMTVMMGAVLGFAAAMNKTKGNVGIGTAVAMIAIAKSLDIMSKAVKNMGELDAVNLAKGLSGIVILMGAIFGLTTGMAKMDAKAGIATSVAMIAIASSLNIMAKAVTKFAELNPKNLAAGMGSIIVLMGAILGLSVGLNKVSGGGIIAAGAGMILIANAISILTPAVESLGSLSLASIGKGMLALAVGLAEMALASNLVSAVGAVGILIMSTAISSLANTLGKLSAMSIGEIAKGLATIAIGLGVFAASAALLTPLIPSMLALSLAIAALGVGVAAVGGGLILMGAGLTSVSGGLLSLLSVSTTTFTVFGKLIETFLQAAFSVLPSLAKAVASSITTFLATIAQAAPKIVESVTTIIGTLLDAINNNVPKIVDTLFNIISSFMSALASNVPELASSGAAIVAGFINGVAKNIPAVVQAGFNLVISFINGLADAIRNNAGEVRDAMINLASSMLEAFLTFFGINSPSTVMNGAGVNIIQGLLNGLKSMISKPVTALTNMAKSMLNSIKSKIAAFKSAASNLMNGIISGISSKVGSITSKISEALKSAVSKVKGYAGSFVSAGKNLVSGIARGIANGASSVFSAVGSIAKKALNKFKSALGIKSPSREFMKASTWITAGIVKGLTKGEKNVDREMANLASSMLNTFSAVDLSNMSPQITPVLDMSEIQNGAKSINSILPSNQVMGINADVTSRFNNSLLEKQQMASNIVSGVKQAVSSAMNEVFANQPESSTTIEVPVVIDGREIAKSTAVYMEPEINKLQVRSNRALGIV